ncbi:MAG: pyridoxamine 5'-phosphate oxidase family protein [Hyphomicrobiales bacterium]|nr:pyridoxamine 5'-phosphate oxidase family protein [Hyphomicrobiales bacterium]
MQVRHDQEAHDKVFELIKDIKVAHLVTVDETNRLRARPMVAQQDRYDGTLWFFTRDGSGKVADIARNSEVLLAYSDPSAQSYVSVTGSAQVVHDRDKVRQLWSEPLRTWFPKGQDDPEIALLRVDVREADYWDVPSSTLVHAYGYLKALATGEPPNPGDSGHVQIKAVT